MKYLILIYSNPASRALWETFSEEDRSAGWQAYADLDAELARSGELLVSEALADVQLTKTVHLRDGLISTTDGPFAETKEHLVGFYFVECDSVERAIEIAAKVPEADLDLVQVRPVMDLGGPDV